ncbi:DDT domain-containing protein [Heracleum sosnowskyi]|uniref:DDT domain-containing protein n=1 Tax=Heracleum sosnowskyi TaxID=360622 RepID=A0AAD8MBU8_9APIA|nr:DDT domain-containing protein [Heracleum sosnowskyi]
MPLYKRKPFALVENPTDLSSDELVFQIRYTNEIFRDYSEYADRINLYRKRVWSCKVTGKGNLTYEEALVSEQKALEKVQQFPSELVALVLREVQFSMLKLNDLVRKISAKVQEGMLVGSELYGRKNNRIYPCKIMRVLVEESDKTQYQVAWLDKEKKVTGNAVVDGDDLIKKLPYSRDVLKSFVRESTYRSVPWVLHDELARKHGISTDPPEDIASKMSIADRKRKRKDENKLDNLEGNRKALRKSNQEQSATEVDSKHVEPKYPIDDLLVHPAADDPDLAQRPSPSRNFNIPMDCIGDFLMVWDFCCSFGRLLQLSPFSLNDFENALRHKESYVALIVETHAAFLSLLINDDGEYRSVTQRNKRKPQITLIKWAEYLCDFLVMVGTDEFTSHLSTVRRCSYGLLDASAKLGILRELVDRVLETGVFKEKLDEYIKECQAPVATNREKAKAEGCKKREFEDRDMLSNGMQATEGHGVGFQGSNSIELVTKQNGAIDLTESTLSNKENSMMKKVDDNKIAAGGMKPSSKKGVQKVDTNDNKDVNEEKILKVRNKYLRREMEKRIIRTNPLGKDRFHNRYYFFRGDSRIFVESSDSTQWGYYRSKDELDSFIGTLNCKGIRERALKKELGHYYGKICLGIQKKLKDDRATVEEADVRRSARIRAPSKENPALAFLKYVNKWK